MVSSNLNEGRMDVSELYEVKNAVHIQAAR